MAECRACLVKNVRMHLITNTRYREMFEKVTGNKLSIEDGRPETICYICNAKLQRSWRFFEMSQQTEKMLSTRLLFGIEMQGTVDMYRLTTTAVKAVSFVDDGTEAAPEVTVTVKEELDDVDEWERFKEEFMESPSDDFENEDYTPIEIPRIEKAKMTDQHKEITKITSLENAEERELKNELLDFIKTEPIENEVTYETNLQNTNTEQLPMKTEDCDNINLTDGIKEEKFPLKADERYHAPKAKPETYYYCDVCVYRCQQSKTLRKHRKHHDPKNRFACEFCLYRFPDELKLARHRNYCTVCNICGKKFHNLNGLRIHVRLHTGEQPFSCDLCGRGFNQKTNLQTHLRVHAREKQYPCEICHKIFPFSSYLKRHMLIHSDNHIDGESMHRIQNCHKLFSRKKKVMSTCTVCGKILRKDSMSMHMRLHTGEQPFSCEKCHRFFNQKCNLLTHVERCHPGDALFACKVCFKTFAMNSELRKHMVTHGVKVEIKQELLAQTEKTIKKFISLYEKEVEQRLEVLTEADKKMELILNLGLKPRVIHPQEPNGIVAPNFNEGGHNVKAIKRKGGMVDPGIKKAKRKAKERTLLRDSINGIKMEGFSPNTKVNIEENYSAADKEIKRESILLQNSQEKDLSSPENMPCTDMSQELQRSDSKAHEQSNDSTKNTEMCNSLPTEDFPELNNIFVDTNRNNEESNVETKMQNIKDVEIKRELISENELPENKVESVENTKPTDDINLTNEVTVESVENTKPTEDINLTNEVTNENMIGEGISIKNELGELQYCNEINSDDIEYFDDSIEIVEVEISDSEEYSNFTEQNEKNEEIAFTNEDLEVTAINFSQNALAGTDENKYNKKVLASKEVEGSQVLLSDEDDHRNEVARRQSIASPRMEVSVIDPDDADDSDIDSEQENIEEDYLDLSDDELIDTDDSFDEVEEPSGAILDLIDAEDKRGITDNPQNLLPNEARLKLRSDLFSCHNEDNLNLNLNVEDIETNRISPVNSDNISTKEANIDFIANNDDLDIMAAKENLLDDEAEFTDAEYLDIDSNDDNLETAANNEYDSGTISNKYHFDDIADAEDISNDSNDALPISAKDFDVFQQKNLISVHRKLNNLIPPYPCELCVTKVFSY